MLELLLQADVQSFAIVKGCGRFHISRGMNPASLMKCSRGVCYAFSSRRGSQPSVVSSREKLWTQSFVSARGVLGAANAQTAQSEKRADCDSRIRPIFAPYQFLLVKVKLIPSLNLRPVELFVKY